ncbi:MAG: hypothetical protein QOC92_4223 [Acidimicrobiaceae bacterium]
MAQRRQRGTHGGSGRESVVDNNGDTSLERQWCPLAAIGALAFVDDGRLRRDDGLEPNTIHPQLTNDLVVHDDRAAAGNGAKGQLRLTRGAKFAHDEHIEGRTDRTGDLVRDGHTPAGQAEDDDTGESRQVAEMCRQLAAGLLPIRKDEPIMDLDRFQQLMRDTYGERDRARGIAASVAWLTEEVGELAQAIRKGTAAQQLEELADVLAWLASLADQLGLSLADAASRYANGCPRCGNVPCTC